MSGNPKLPGAGDEIRDFYLRGKQALDRKALGDAEQLFEKATIAFRGLDHQARLDEQLSMALSLTQLASLARSQGKHDVARQRYQESAAIYEQLATSAKAEGRQDIAERARLESITAQQFAKDLTVEKGVGLTLEAKTSSQQRVGASPSRDNANRVSQTVEEVKRQKRPDKWSWVRKLPSQEQADTLFREAQLAEERGQISTADRLYHRVAQLYELMHQDKSMASFGLAASLYNLGYHAAHRGDIFFGMNYYRKAAEVLHTVSQAAELQGNNEMAAAARDEAEHIFSLADNLAEQCDQLLLSPKSKQHEMQERLIAQLESERAHANQSWAQGLGRI